LSRGLASILKLFLRDADAVRDAARDATLKASLLASFAFALLFRAAAPSGYDRTVTHVRWTFTGNLSQTSPNNAGNVSFIVRIR